MDTTTVAVSPLVGIHHVTAITGNAQKNVEFYTDTLGLRLVKVTINYDDPRTYHLYYGDGLGRPGTLMTHFVWPGGRVAVNGTGHVMETAFAVPVGAASYWQERLASIPGAERTRRFGHDAITFLDPDAMPLALIEDPHTDDAHYWQHGHVPHEFAIRALHGVTLAEVSETGPASILVDRFGYREIAREGNRIRYETAGNSAGRFADVVIVPQAARTRMGVGQVHHVAFRTPTDEQQASWLQQLRIDGHNVSPVMDRNYFHSIYFREPGGVLFEIATDGPGMTYNESAEELGTHIVLPEWLEAQRAEVEAALPPITLAKRVEVSAAT